MSVHGLGLQDSAFAPTCEKYVSITVGIMAVPTDIVLKTMTGVELGGR